MLMTVYRRPWVEGGTYLFTVNLAERPGNRLLVDNVVLPTDIRTLSRYPDIRSKSDGYFKW
jgi:hypothetical protein